MGESKNVLINLPPEKLIDNPWNPNVVNPENEKKLIESIKVQQMIRPIIARQLDDGSYQILGGRNTTRAAQKLGLREIPVFVHVGITDEEAKRISITDNTRYGEDDSFKQAELLASMTDRDGLADFIPTLTIENIDAMMAMTNINMDDLTLEDIESEIVPEIKEKRAAKTTAIMRFKVNITDSYEIQALIDKVIAEQGMNENDSLTNAGDALVHILFNKD